MTKLSWDQSGARKYEFGVDRGVLYPLNATGVVWNGLTSVDEKSSGGDVTSYYLDGVNYMNSLSTEEFSGTISAFTYPDEFYELDGMTFAAPGLGFGQQPRKVFGISYRTKLGNDLAGQDYGYKIHLVYNATASPSSRSNNTLGESVDPVTFSWDITTTPVEVIGMKALSHIIIDSTKVGTFLLAAIEDVLYGSISAEARMPNPDELISLFGYQPAIQVINNGDGSFTIIAPDSNFTFPSATEFNFTSSSAVYLDAISYTVSSL